jgi:hypothetical protein
VYTIYKGFGSIRKKPEINALPLKRKSRPGNRSMEVVMDSMPSMDDKILENGKEIPWYQGKNVHWYILHHWWAAYRGVLSQDCEW